MEALAAFGIACNVIQVISFSHEVLSTCKRVCRDGSPQPDLEKNSNQLQRLSTKLLESINEPQSTLSKQQYELRSMATRLCDTIGQLITLLDDVKTDGASSRLTAVKKTFKNNFRYKQKIRELEKAIQSHQNTLDSGMLAHLWYVS